MSLALNIGGLVGSSAVANGIYGIVAEFPFELKSGECGYNAVFGRENEGSSYVLFSNRGSAFGTDDLAIVMTRFDLTGASLVDQAASSLQQLLEFQKANLQLLQVLTHPLFTQSLFISSLKDGSPHWELSDIVNTPNFASSIFTPEGYGIKITSGLFL